MARPLFLKRKGLSEHKFPTPNTGPPLSFDSPIDDGEPLWGGVALRSVSAVIAGTAAALATSVAIANSFNHQDEISLPPAAGASQGLAPFIGLGSDPCARPFDYNDDIVPQAALDEDGWRPPLPVPPRLAALPQAEDDTLPTRVDEEYQWSAAALSLKPVTSVFSEQDELGQPPSIGADDDSWQAPKGDPVEIVIIQWPQMAGGVPQSQAAIDDDYGWSGGSYLVKPIQFRVDHQDEVGTVVGTAPDDDAGWFPNVHDPFLAVVIQWPQMAGSVPQSQETATAPDDDAGWFPNVQDPFLATIVHWPQMAGGVPQATVPIVDDEYWLRPAEKIDLRYAPAFSDNDEISVPPATGGGGGGPPVWNLQANAEYIFWYQNDDLPIPAAPLTIEENEWSAKPYLLAPKPFVIGHQDEPVPIPPPLTDDATDWKVFVPAILSPQALYLPDPEDVPALATPPDVTPVIDGHFPGGSRKPKSLKLKPKPPTVPGLESLAEEAKPQAKPQAKPVAKSKATQTVSIELDKLTTATDDEIKAAFEFVAEFVQWLAQQDD